MAPMNPNLCTGDPVYGTEAASFSRFVLPFRYHLQGGDKAIISRVKSQNKSCFFERANVNDWLHSPEGQIQDTSGFLDCSRSRYLAPETTEVLYHRAQWFILRTKPDNQQNACFRTFNIPSWRRQPSSSGEKGSKSRPKSIKVCMRPPALVLFESPLREDEIEPDEAAKKEEDLLHVGFLVVELFFPKNDSMPEATPVLEDLLALNDQFRNWVRPFREHSQLNFPDNYRYFLEEAPIDHNQSIGNITQRNCRDDPELERRLYFERWAWLLDLPILESSTDKSWSILPVKEPGDWADEARKWVDPHYSPDPNMDKSVSSLIPGKRAGMNRGWSIYSDHRTFVWTCAIYKSEKLSQTIEHCDTCARDRMLPEELGHWIKLLNVDAAEIGTDASRTTTFEREWAFERTYRRWAKKGTLYGFNYHCGAMLSGPVKNPDTWRHFGQMYFDQALLLLYIRMVLFRFSMRLYEISAKARDKNRLRDKPEEMEVFRNDFESLRFKFDLFCNLYQFPLMSNQQQAIEMYSIARRQMDLDDLFKEIQAEIKGTHEFLVNYQSQQINQSAGLLTIVATIGLGLSLVIGFFGMNIIVDHIFGYNEEKNMGRFLIEIIVFIVVCCGLWAITPEIIHKINSLRYKTLGWAKNHNQNKDRGT